MLLSAPLCSLLQETWERLLASSKYSDQQAFTVVFQPFFYETHLVSEGGHEEPEPPPLPLLPSRLL